MKIPLTYAEAKQRHPQKVAAAVRALRASSSKHKAAAPSKLEWEYLIVVNVESISLKEIRSGAILKRMEERAKLSLETRIQEVLGDSTAFLHAFLGLWKHDSEPLPEIPPEYVKHVRDQFHKYREEQEAYDALPQAEKDARALGRLDVAKRHKAFDD